MSWEDAQPLGKDAQDAKRPTISRRSAKTRQKSGQREAQKEVESIAWNIARYLYIGQVICCGKNQNFQFPLHEININCNSRVQK